MLRLITFIALLFLMTSCSISGKAERTEEALAYDKSFEIIGKEKLERVGDIHPDLLDPALTKESSEANLLTIDHKADQPYQVPTGRYKILGTGTGYVYLYDDQGDLVFREYVAYGIEKVQVDIKDSYDFRFNGLEAIVIEEIDVELTRELSPGVYEVGSHIEAGSYELEAVGFGTITVLRSKDDYDLYELTSSPYTPAKIQLEFMENQKVIVNGLSEVVLDPL